MSERQRVIVVGASAGAVQVLLDLVPALPVDGPPVVIVVHVPPDRDNALPALLSDRCAVAVKEAEDKEALRCGTVYLAPPDYHLLIEQDSALALSSDEPVNYSRPSIDVLFESAADAVGPALTGVILTGANQDGARGLRAVAAAGGHAIVQSPSTAQAPAMPLAALSACPQAEMLTLEDIIQYFADGAPDDR